MGVHGLWEIVEPTSKPVRLESLEDKRLAVDASIWIYQFLKAVRDTKGDALQYSHVIGFFRRICKLLYFGIKPVFVFDGAVSPLKRETINKRKEIRQGKRDSAAKTAKKILALQLQQSVEKKEPVSIDTSSPLGKNYRGNDEWELPKIEGFKYNKSDGRIASVKEFQAVIDNVDDELDGIDLDSINPASKEFDNLPKSTQYIILNALRLKSRLRMGYSKEQLEHIFPNSMEFSKFQIDMVKRRNFFTQKLIDSTGLHGESTLLNGKIASEKNKEYKLIRSDNGWALSLQNDDGSSVKKAINLEDEDESDEDDEDDIKWEEVDTKTREREDTAPDYSIRASLLTTTSKLKELNSFGGKAFLDTKNHTLTSRFYQSPYKNIVENISDFSSSDDDDDGEETSSNMVATSKNINTNGGLKVSLEAKLQDIEDASSDSDYTTFVKETKQMEKMQKSNIESTELPKTITTVHEDASIMALNNSAATIENTKETVNNQNCNLLHKISALSKGNISPDNCQEPMNGVSTKTSLSPTFIPSNKETLILPKDKDSTLRQNFNTVSTYDENKNCDNSTDNTDSHNSDINDVTTSKNEYKPVPSWFGENPISNIKNIHDTVGGEEPSFLFGSHSISAQSKEQKKNLLPSVVELSMVNEDPDNHEDEINHSFDENKEKMHNIGQGTKNKVEVTPKCIKNNKESTPHSNSGTPNLPLVEVQKHDDKVFDYDFFEDDEEALVQQLEEEENEYNNFFKPALTNASAETGTFLSKEDLYDQAKRDKRDADEVTTTMIYEVQQLLSCFGIPYITAPMEAEAQCAELLNLKLVDAIATDDSDIFLFGGDKVFRKMFNEKHYVEYYSLDTIAAKLGLDRHKMIELAQLLGSDYTTGIKGIGPVSGVEILATFGSLEQFYKWYTEGQLNPDVIKKETGLERKLRKALTRNQIDLDSKMSPKAMVEDAYLNPVVDKDETSFVWGNPDLDQLRTLLNQTANWSKKKADEVLIPLIQSINKRKKENHNKQRRLTEFFPTKVDSSINNLGRRLKEATAQLKKKQRTK
ncbi:ssDNA endodeoxyribonuclease RAD2 SCDLUD_004745 [Saccharomycodes ludwigii]|uniref:ssDNA endodeoxyribonuclease RAD2 n=1 Tax=Saccharomycodes ludwigii TaxID=36035 RepID=UPI001E8C839F|nr:hypothetical protein SCDLUD_004745 [Saccharomycodes ludwigii]KAH3899308.1 hypothetical protein SCDLUD_004745 [Saccharomycodes ludwigii]